MAVVAVLRRGRFAGPGRADRPRRPLRQVHRRHRSQRPATRLAGADLGSDHRYGQDPLGPEAAGAAADLDRDQPGRSSRCHGPAGLPPAPDRTVLHVRKLLLAAARPWSASGSYDADVAFPEQSTFPSHGRVLAFNAVVGGKRAILAHIYGAQPGADHPHHRLPHPRKQRHLRHDPHRLPAGDAQPLGLPESHQPSACTAISPTGASAAATSAPPAMHPRASPARPSPSLARR